MKASKKTLRQHTYHCIEEPWGGDKRYTRCVNCGAVRFYPDGWDGIHHLVPVRGVAHNVLRSEARRKERGQR